MRRRDFIKVIAGSAAAWPLAARAQQTERMQHIGVLMNRATDDPEGHARVAAFTQGLQDAGFTVGRDVQIDVRWGADDLERERTAAMELLALAPDIGAGFVDDLARPGGSTTGFMIYEYSLSGKWLQLLKEVAPSVMRVAIIRNPDNPVGSLYSARSRPRRGRSGWN
jgi:putative ABC transport system substrate-binding protein